MITDDFEPRFSLKHMFKDVQIALAMAADFGVDLPASSAFAGSAMSGLQNGWGDQDFSVVARHCMGIRAAKIRFLRDSSATKRDPARRQRLRSRRKKKRSSRFSGSK